MIRANRERSVEDIGFYSLALGSMRQEEDTLERLTVAIHGYGF